MTRPCRKRNLLSEKNETSQESFIFYRAPRYKSVSLFLILGWKRLYSNKYLSISKVLNLFKFIGFAVEIQSMSEVILLLPCINWPRQTA